MKTLAPLAAALAAAAMPVAAAQWTAVRSNDAVKLSIDPASVARKGDQVSLRYLVDYRKPQSNALYQVSYRSMVTKATLRCRARTVLIGAAELYTGPGATGVLIATAQPTPKEQVYGPVEKDTSDEDLWRHVCEKKAAEKKP